MRTAKTIRVYWKLLKRRFLLIPSFCKHCGRDVHDFSVPDKVWQLVDLRIRHGHTLCYDCFCEVCQQIGLPVIWRLVKVSSAWPFEEEGDYANG